MSDLNWCTYCDNAISPFSNSLYCSEDCLRSDALNHHPLLGYDYAELKDFPRSSPSPTLTASSSSTASLSPCLSPIASFKEVPAFQLNTPQDSLYQHFYQQKKKPTTTPSPILLSSWTKTIL
ncbi:uncharacterized protein EV154DRAFT_511083 [Mucor mucedo]|uniref:Uncharacterized protein n=1 Tax=Mucor saturninus TaxID=64648 RepID=A0A8H7RJI6_9FUNG|nr:uncharacterized protein EV154DRAFT_511083 [Mucor mucedo]KAG2211728.1 hypothetical protein INT47_008825 [Mucor saturninus]KAI7890640.1 hypothetical protein EV154DRAFT_511083 [Mucor mucedo]